mmetsp:Transcript_30427/g.63793  ORF Transcript_30427/g.63793 Transcript_30427/m.63793 type:complete len:297 (-) Transcript_30427:575-1465(-)
MVGIASVLSAQNFPQKVFFSLKVGQDPFAFWNVIGAVDGIKSFELLEPVRDPRMRRFKAPGALVVALVAEPTGYAQDRKQLGLDFVVVPAPVFGVEAPIGPALRFPAEVKLGDPLRSPLHFIGRQSAPSDPENRRDHGRTRERGNGGRSRRGTRKGRYPGSNSRCRESPGKRKQGAGEDSGPTDLDTPDELIPGDAVRVATVGRTRLADRVTVLVVGCFGFSVSGGRGQQNQSPGDVLLQCLVFSCGLEKPPSFEASTRVFVVVVIVSCISGASIHLSVARRFSFREIVVHVALQH